MPFRGRSGKSGAKSVTCSVCVCDIVYPSRSIHVMHLLKECIQVYGFYHVIVCLHKSTLLRVIPTMAFQGIYIYIF